MSISIPVLVEAFQNRREVTHAASQLVYCIYRQNTGQVDIAVSMQRFKRSSRVS